ncbi:hypothetical protein [Deinococcus koreensis]|uniref:hypothetical protein n=1 Tax=Deinococcus koreensis TaxID=2054903 RepID=UPI00105734F6|nr:hypothetical protein [Deinococcus koreensis]
MTEDVAAQTVSPLSRLIKITKQIKNYEFPDEMSKYRRGDGHFKLGPCISYSLGREVPENGYSLLEMIEDYSEMHKICLKTLEYVTKNSPKRALESNIANIQTVVDLYISNTINDHADIIHGFSNEVLARVELVGDNLADKEIESIIPLDEINAISEKINEIIDFIHRSSLDDSVRDKLIQTLLAILDGINRINYIGPEKMLNNIDMLLGQNVQNVIMDQKTGDSEADVWEIWKKCIEMAEGAQKLVESYKYFTPFLLVGYKYISSTFALPSSDK